MPKVFNFNVDDEVEIVDSTGVMKSYIGKKGVISEQLEVSQYDYKVKFDNGSDIKFKESELRKLNDVYEPKVGDIVKHIPHQRIAKVLHVDSKYKQVELEFDSGTLGVFPINKIELLERKEEEKVNIQQDKLGKFGEIGLEIGKFTDSKNKQYGSSVDATYEMIKVLMDRYTYDDENYLMPKSLLPHILLQVRMMDKQNRIFNNPSGKGDSESPYKDLTGYSIIGVEMVDRLK